MREKRRVYLVIFCISILLIGIFSPIYGLLSEDSRSKKQLMLAEDLSENTLQSLDKSSFEVVKRYSDDALIRIEPAKVDLFRKKDTRLNGLPSRTQICINGYSFDISKGGPDMDRSLKKEGYRSGTEGLYIVHMIGPIHPDWRRSLKKDGADIIDYVHHYAYEVEMTPKESEKMKARSFVDWVGIYHPGYKYPKDIRPGKITIKSSSERKTREKIKSRFPKIEQKVNGEKTSRFTVNASSLKEIRNLAKMNDVYWIAEDVEPKLHSEMESQIIGGGAWYLDNGYLRGKVKNSAGNPKTPYRKYGDYGAYINQLGYTGKNVTIAFADTGLGNGTSGDAGHPDFTGRVVGGHAFGNLTSWKDTFGHGTHVVGSAAGDTYEGMGKKGQYPGFGPYYMAQGLAYDSKIFSAKIFDPGWVDPNYSKIFRIPKREANAYVHSNSWGASTDGDYVKLDSAFDRAVRDANQKKKGNQPMVITVSAGNSGSGGRKTINSPGNAKNVITVGSTETFMPDGEYYGGSSTGNPNHVSDFSSKGWTNDSRIKPDVVAPGQNILSTSTPTKTSGGMYIWKSGTSMSNPAVAGASAVVIDWYRKNYGERPSPAMVKSLLINTARPLEGYGHQIKSIPNPAEGWGMVDISKLEYPKKDPINFELIDQKRELQTGESARYEIKPEKMDTSLKISLVWTDKEARPNDVKTLKNNLNLEVVSPDGSVYRGNAFDQDKDPWSDSDYTYPDTPTMEDFDTDGDGWDDVNNVENVYISPNELRSGKYEVTVKGENIPCDSDNDGVTDQDYALTIYNAEKNELKITSPERSEVVRKDDITIDISSKKSLNRELRLDKGNWIEIGEKSSYSFENLKDGKHTIEVRNSEDVKDRLYDNISFSINTSPWIDIISPKDGEVVQDEKLTIDWKTHFSEKVEVSYNGKDWMKVGSGSNFTVDLQKRGKNRIEVKAVGKDGDHSMRTVNIYFYKRIETININGNEDFSEKAEERGWKGKGTKNDPFVIEGYDINGGSNDTCISIQNVTHHFVIKDCRIRNSNRTSEVPEKNSGIFLEKTRNGIITNNTFRLNANGVRLKDSKNIKIEKNLFINNHRGIYLSSCEEVSLENNDISKQHYPIYGKGIELKNSFKVEIDDNDIFNNEKGIHLLSSNKSEVISNHIQYNDEGLYLEESKNNTVSGNEVTLNDEGIYIQESNGNHISDNTAERNSLGLYLFSSDDNEIIGNNLYLNDYDGLSLAYSDKNEMKSNTVKNNRNYGIDLSRSKNNVFEDNQLLNNSIYLSGDSKKYWTTQEIDETNTIGGEKIYYWKNRSGGYISGDAGQVILANTTDVRIKDLHISGGSIGVLLGFCNGTHIEDNDITDQNIAILLKHSSRNYIEGNKLSKNVAGIDMVNSTKNVIKDNIITKNELPGIYLYRSDKNLIFGNNISYNEWYGLYLTRSTGNTIYHNEIISNENQAYDDGENDWDNGSKGNYWSDYRSEYKNAEQKEGSNIWDTAYDIRGGNNQDGYPLTDRQSIDDFSISILTPSSEEKLFSTEQKVVWASKGGKDPVEFKVRSNQGRWIDVGYSKSYTFSELRKGKKTVIVRGTGERGISKSEKVVFNVDTGVSINITSPKPSQVIRRSYITFEWDSHNEEKIEIRLEGKDASKRWLDVTGNSSHTFSKLVDGKYTVHLRAKGTGGSSEEVSMNFTVKIVDLGIKNPREDSVLNEKNLTIKWDSKNAEYYRLKINDGRWIDIESTRKVKLRGLKDGEYEISIRAVDEAGYSEVKVVDFIIDTGTPRVDILRPKEGELIRGRSVQIKWEGTDNVTEIEYYEIKIDDGGWKNMSSGTRYTLYTLEKGNHEIWVRAWDKAGNSKVQKVDFEVETIDISDIWKIVLILITVSLILLGRSVLKRERYDRNEKRKIKKLTRGIPAKRTLKTSTSCEIS